MIKVGFSLSGGRSWTGGYNYFLNLIKVIGEFSNNLTPVVFFGTDVPEDDISPFLKIERCTVRRSNLLNSDRKLSSIVQALFWGSDKKIMRLFHSERIDVVFENAQFYGWRNSFPSIAWIPDFQHKYLGKYFSLTGKIKRELGFRAQIKSGRVIMLSSEDSESDCHRFYPETLNRTKVVRFAVPGNNELTLDYVRKVASTYDLPKRFFFLPNQFWSHKNHRLVIQALHQLKSDGYDFTIAASGLQKDPRNPHHFKEICKMIARYGLENNFRLLGLIPYSHIIPLMLASDALINPSYFEGWSTVVEEAKSCGVPLILSDIKVHREQVGSDGLYFNPSSVEDLTKVLKSFEAVNDIEKFNSYQKACTLSKIRLKGFAEDFAATANIALGFKGKKYIEK